MTDRMGHHWVHHGPEDDMPYCKRCSTPIEDGILTPCVKAEFWFGLNPPPHTIELFVRDSDERDTHVMQCMSWSEARNFANAILSELETAMREPIG